MKFLCWIRLPIKPFVFLHPAFDEYLYKFFQREPSVCSPLNTRWHWTLQRSAFSFFRNKPTGNIILRPLTAKLSNVLHVRILYINIILLKVHIKRTVCSLPFSPEWRSSVDLERVTWQCFPVRDKFYSTRHTVSNSHISSSIELK
jgi:hypothetical protein